MRSYLDVMDRGNTGDWISEEDWDLEKVALTTRRLVRKYKLAWEKDHVVTDDPSLADAVFQAGFELAATIGVYQRNTERVIRFSEAELVDGLRAMPQTLVVGEGKDARTLYARCICDDRLPLIWGGPPGAPFPERLFLAHAISYAQEPIIDLLTCGTLTEVDGKEVRTASPMEIVATRRELNYLREARLRAGRPGMGMLAAQSSVSELGDLAVAHPDYLRPCDAHLVPMLNELKMDDRNIARAANSLEYGMLNASLPCVIVGGLGGDAPGAAVVNVASFILSNLVCLADYHICHPIHVRHVATSTRAVLWVISIVGQAFARNAPAIIVADVYPKAGTGTRELLYETTANAIVNAVTGNHLEGCGSADGKLPNASGLESRLMGEVAHAVTRQETSLDQANALVLALLERYEHIFESPDVGLPFDQVYDPVAVQPTDEWQEMYEGMKVELRGMGLDTL